MSSEGQSETSLYPPPAALAASFAVVYRATRDHSAPVESTPGQ